MQMGIGPLGAPNVIIKRKFRWTFSISTPCGNLPPYTCKTMERQKFEIEETALEFLKDGLSFSVGDLRLGIEGKNTLFVTGWSQYLDFENLTRSKAIQEIEEIKNVFMKMVESSIELKEFIQKRSVKYNLAFNYGMGSIGVCSEQNGVIEWESEIKK